MVTRDDIVSMWLSGREVKYCMDMAKRAEIGGISNIRSNHSERMGKIKIDQIVGQIGQYALAIYLFGEPQKYYIQRMVADINPTVGDNGQDIIGSNIDVKTSLIRSELDYLEYHLAVRPKELYRDHIYILALVEPNFSGSIMPNQDLNVYLLGWSTAENLPSETSQSGVFQGAHILKAYDLQPLMPIKWNWRK
jgi:hypothetical protein